MRLGDRFHLTFCSNIFPGESWHEVFSNLTNSIPAIRQGVHLDGPFGIGLRLSAQAAEELEQALNLAQFKEFLRNENCYVFTINGFPYGAFHGTRVKEHVYLPDWRDKRRLAYTDRLARILGTLLPEGPDIEGSISTSPGAYKAEVRSDGDVKQMSSMMLAHVSFLDELRKATGKTISLALEPEPCCHLETVRETIAFFEDHLFSAEARGTVPEEVVRRHIGVCYDACHMAVEFEAIPEALDAFTAAGIRICKVQISSALRLRFQEGDRAVHELFAPFAEGTYLHQVVESTQGVIKRFCDLPEALAETAHASRSGAHKEWRVHFHIPIFLAEIGRFHTTQDYLEQVLAYLKERPICRHLEVETYTWDVLPPEYRNVDMVTAIVRELDWALNHLKP